MKNDLSINFRELHNDQHFLLFGEFGNVVTEFGVESLKIVPQFENWKLQFKLEDDALKLIPKSALTAKINLADKQRDNNFHGLSETCKTAASRHFKPEVKEAAEDLLIVFNAYGNIARKPLSEKTSAIANLVQELTEKHADSVEAAGLSEWINALMASNNTCHQLMQERWDESASRTGISMKQARAGVEAAYGVIMERIFALKVIEEDGIYDSFIRRMRVVIDTFNAAIAQRTGRNRKDDDSSVAMPDPAAAL